MVKPPKKKRKIDNIPEEDEGAGEDQNDSSEPKIVVDVGPGVEIEAADPKQEGTKLPASVPRSRSGSRSGCEDQPQAVTIESWTIETNMFPFERKAGCPVAPWTLGFALITRILISWRLRHLKLHPSPLRQPSRSGFNRFKPNIRDLKWINSLFLKIIWQGCEIEACYFALPLDLRVHLGGVLLTVCGS